jgi:hypothetical protein
MESRCHARAPPRHEWRAQECGSRSEIPSAIPLPRLALYLFGNSQMRFTYAREGQRAGGTAGQKLKYDFATRIWRTVTDALTISHRALAPIADAWANAAGRT